MALLGHTDALGQLAGDLLADTNQRLARLRTDLLLFGHVENPAFDGQLVGIRDRVVAPIFSGLVPLVADLFGRCGNGSRRHFGLGERQALLPQVGHNPLAFGAKKLSFQPSELLGEQGHLRFQRFDMTGLLLRDFLQIGIFVKGIQHAGNIAQIPDPTKQKTRFS